MIRRSDYPTGQLSRKMSLFLTLLLVVLMVYLRVLQPLDPYHLLDTLSATQPSLLHHHIAA